MTSLNTTSASLPLNGTVKISHSDGIPVELSATPTPDKQTGVKILPPEFYAPFISADSRRRKPNNIRGLFPLEKKPGVISLLAGKPNPETFPISNLQVTVRNPTDGSETKLDISGSDISAGLQYGSTAGYEPLVEWVEGLQAYSHRRMRDEGWRISIGSGSQDLLYKAFHALVNPGDCVLIETPVYSGVLPLLDTLRGEVVPIETDANGIQSSSLRSVLENWPAARPLPKFLYTVPYGCNPTGMTASRERRLEVLDLARKYNFLILEDDPYYYLYYGRAARPPSYFALELEQGEVGLVLRFDSVSKILSAGIRIGFASGPKPILDAMDLHTASANLQVSTLTQVIALTIFKHFGYDGFKLHTENVSEFYRQRRDVFEAAMHRQLDGLVEWSTPEAGMFFWFKLLLNDPSNSTKVIDDDSEEIIRSRAYENGVLALPGTSFMPTGSKTAYVRASFSVIDPGDIEEALRRLREVILKARSGA
ncbi:PLP-dependent transferase [Fomitiporia mediterranea MF3/22]|uniref:PLP-dependent transferase n=1 Tax=Fomitiporia mediterranea (strain MF3/22) TaxID=694068 RepID=UPI0004408ED0|nr:PLP-dependent transferase [Fomitiporia mediterranea MF3/22]EJD07066.1 PLP-dependent transferase [Fomitiporia mediterranea MF3/22]